MKIRWLAVILLGVTQTLALQAAQKIDVDVYLERGNWTRSLGPSLGLATKLFERINVRLKWHSGKPPESRRDNTMMIGIQIQEFAPKSLVPTALAEARPFSMSRRAITIYQDRVEKVIHPIPSMNDVLLAYIFAHELGHVLQSSRSHADEGVMRANWTYSDNMAMLSRRLGFTEADAARIRGGAIAKEMASR
jgi:hypothetical protein